MRKGFTLIEIMTVVAIIALLVAIAIPNLLGAKMTANQVAAMANIRVLCTEEEIYAAGVGNAVYYNNVSAFISAPSAAAVTYCSAPCTTAGIGCGGYVYACTTTGGGYTFSATPVSTRTGTIYYTGTPGGQITKTAYPVLSPI